MKRTDRRPRTPYQRILHASELGTGVRLSREEVTRLAGDFAIETRASLDCCEECEATGRHFTCRHPIPEDNLAPP